MNLKVISVEQFATDPKKALRRARRKPLLVRAPGLPTMVLRPLVDDDLADEIIVKNPRFRASIKKALKNREAGKGIPLAEVRRRLKS